ncbi:MAG: RidA family protein [Longimicrobiales bacterium]|nr:RidA family protein [Longimicrobiales bacterium]
MHRDLPALATRLTLGLLAVGFLTLGAAPAAAQGYDPEARLAEMGITLPERSVEGRVFNQVVQTGNLVFTSGHAPCGEWPADAGEFRGRGKVPSEVSAEMAQLAARQVAICTLASLKAHLGDLSRVTRVVRVFGMVNSEGDFTGQSGVMNAASQFLLDVFGEERGRHVRSAVGMAALPVGLTVEIEMVFEVDGGDE